MDVKKVQKAKEEVEMEINKLLSEFEEKVGLKMSSISVDRRKMMGAGRYPSTNNPVVSLEIKI